MRKKEIIDRIRLLEYENAKLRHEVDEMKRTLKPVIRPMAPFPRIEMHSMGCSWGLPGYEELKDKYRPL
jgi:regulator of replication initiation timing